MNKFSYIAALALVSTCVATANANPLLRNVEFSEVPSIVGTPTAGIPTLSSMDSIPHKRDDSVPLYGGIVQIPKMFAIAEPSSTSESSSAAPTSSATESSTSTEEAKPTETSSEAAKTESSTEAPASTSSSSSEAAPAETTSSSSTSTEEPAATSSSTETPAAESTSTTDPAPTSSSTEEPASSTSTEEPASTSSSTESAATTEATTEQASTTESSAAAASSTTSDSIPTEDSNVQNDTSTSAAASSTTSSTKSTSTEKSSSGQVSTTSDKDEDDKTTSSKKSNVDDDSDGLTHATKGIIIGAAIGGILLVSIIGGLMYRHYLHKKQRRNAPPPLSKAASNDSAGSGYAGYHSKQAGYDPNPVLKSSKAYYAPPTAASSSGLPPSPPQTANYYETRQPQQAYQPQSGSDLAQPSMFEQDMLPMNSFGYPVAEAASNVGSLSSNNSGHNDMTQTSSIGRPYSTIAPLDKSTVFLDQSGGIPQMMVTDHSGEYGSSIVNSSNSVFYDGNTTQFMAPPQGMVGDSLAFAIPQAGMNMGDSYLSGKETANASRYSSAPYSAVPFSATPTIMMDQDGVDSPYEGDKTIDRRAMNIAMAALRKNSEV